MKNGLVIDEDGDKEWYLNGELHRSDGPAIERSDGTKFWYINGKRHREDGPAIKYTDGNNEWYQNDNLHREDGPAIIYTDGGKLWYLDGQKMSELVHYRVSDYYKTMSTEDQTYYRLKIDE